MPVISTPSGSTFNGGTITNGLEIDNPSSSLNALTIKGALGDTNDTVGPGGEVHVAANYDQANDVWALRVDPGNNNSARGLEVRNTAGAAVVWYTDNNGSIIGGTTTIDFGNGAMSIVSAADGQTPLFLRPHSAADLIIDMRAAPSGIPVASVDATGVYRTQAHAAPADGTLVAGECALWFDSTNGASKLMIKAKSANGTVVTGSVPLA